MKRFHAPDLTIDMTPMIDIVFQLLIFFIMSFKIAANEGDFNIKMPLAAASGSPTEPTDVVPMKLRLTAGPGGQLTGITLGDLRFDSFAKLHQYIISQYGNDQGAGSRESAEIELDCDYNLRYEEVVSAVTAVSGYTTGNGEIVKLIEKLKFAPIRREG